VASRHDLHGHTEVLGQAVGMAERRDQVGLSAYDHSTAHRHASSSREGTDDIIRALEQTVLFALLGIGPRETTIVSCKVRHGRERKIGNAERQVVDQGGEQGGRVPT
jgi:hypothetical protein